MQAFRMFDKNNSGSISLKDLKKILINMCPHLLSTYVEASLPLVSLSLTLYKCVNNIFRVLVIARFNFGQPAKCLYQGNLALSWSFVFVSCYFNSTQLGKSDWVSLIGAETLIYMGRVAVTALCVVAKIRPHLTNGVFHSSYNGQYVGKVGR